MTVEERLDELMRDLRQHMLDEVEDRVRLEGRLGVIEATLGLLVSTLQNGGGVGVGLGKVAGTGAGAAGGVMLLAEAARAWFG